MKTLRLPLVHRALVWAGMLLLLCGGVSLPARAQDTDAADPPSRVGRLAEVEGEVWVYDDEAGEWVEAARNRPVTGGDRLSTAGSGRAEVRVGTTTLRIDRNTELEIATLDDSHVTVRLHNGDVAVRLRSREAAEEFLLETAEGGFSPERAGSYRFARDDDTTDAIVLNGQLQLRAQDAGVTVKAGQRYRFWQDGGTQFELAELRRDAFDDWVAARDDREERSVSARYVSPEMTGIEDLDRYGRWEQDPEYGAMWIPRTVVAGWAPYRMGHWVWISPWGWTWVDDAPWGFAPFHYGRWVERRSVWCWVPGAYVARPVYAPALVAWVGGPGASVSINIGRRVPPTVGWFPLGPREVYVPGHRYTPHYMRHVNGNQVPRGFDFNPWLRNPGQAMAGGHYRYRDAPGAVTLVPRQVVERRQPVAPAIVGVGGRPVPGFNPGRPQPIAPVGPGGRPPGLNPRPPQVGIPAAPGRDGDRYGAPRFGRDEPRRDVPRRDDRPGRAEPSLPTVVVPAPRPQPDMAPQPRPQTSWSNNPNPNREPGMWGGRDPGRPWPREEAVHPQRPVPQPVAPQQPPQQQQPMPQPRWNDGRRDNDGHRQGGFQPRPQVQQPVPQPQPQPQPQVQQPRPQQPAFPPPQMSRPQPQPQQPQPGFTNRGPGGENPRGGNAGDPRRDDGPRHRRVD